MSADQACLRCRTQKRRCDKIRPHCTLCKRLNKHCLYQLPPEAPRLLPVTDWTELTPVNLRHTLEVQVSSIVGDGLQLQEAAALYFRTVHTWFPIISETRYNAQLASMRVKMDAAPADFSLLTLCMALVCKEPTAGEIPVPARLLYTSMRGFVTLLETMGINSLEILQSRILLTIFEIGHAMYPSAYISAAANIRAAVSLGIGSLCEGLHTVFHDPQKAREAQKCWCAILIIDSYVSLESGQAPSTHRGGGPIMNQESKDLSNVELDSPHCLFTAAMVCLSDARVSGGVDPEPFLQPIKALLSYLGMRWVAAKRYLEKVETAQRKYDLYIELSGSEPQG